RAPQAHHDNASHDDRNSSATAQFLQEKPVNDLPSLEQGMFGYSLTRPTHNQDWYYKVFETCANFRCGIEGWHTESGPGVYEAALEYGGIQAMADIAVLFKLAVKNLSSKYGITPCFMAKPRQGLPGNSGHVHVSLCDPKTGSNLLARDAPDPNPQYEDIKHLSDTGRHFLAGILDGLADVMPIVAPTVNSYKRLVENFWAPVTVSWGLEHRAASIRVIAPPTASPKGTRFEVRVAGADANPYLVFAAILALGLRGIEKGLPLPIAPLARGQDVGGTGDKGERLAKSLKEATERFARRESVAREVFGDEFVEHFAGTREHEVRLWDEAVTDCSRTSTAAQRSISTAPDSNDSSTEPRDALPRDASQKDTSSSPSSKAGSEFDLAGVTLRPTKTFPVSDFATDLPAEKKRPSSASDEKVYTSNDYHQADEDGRRTPPRLPTAEARPEALCTSSGSSSESSSASSSDPSHRFKKLQQLVFDTGKTGLFYTLTGRNDRERPKIAVLNLVALQRMNIHKLQTHLAYNAAWGFDDGRFDEDPIWIQEQLNLYCDGVRNLDFMREKAKLGYDKDPFLVKSSRALERGALESAGLIPDFLLPKGELPLPEDHEHPLLFNESGGRQHANEMTLKKQRLERFAMASFGGLLIIVPMLIMANIPGKVASLVTSCVAITIFAALVTLVTKLGPHEVLASVAAYAAVLVVFVGLSLEKR
ncbi:glutamine synthetase/guanido kinase, partial [Hortaea werneckii]